MSIVIIALPAQGWENKECRLSVNFQLNRRRGEERQTTRLSIISPGLSGRERSVLEAQSTETFSKYFPGK